MHSSQDWTIATRASTSALRADARATRLRDAIERR
jgi:hypothetical protein